MAWRQAIGNFIRSGTGISVFGGLFSTSGYVFYKDYARYERMSEVYSTGNILAPFQENNCEIAYFKRPEVEDTLGRVLRSSLTNQFYIVGGEVGCGKSRTIVELVRRIIEASGKNGTGAPVYLQITQGVSFPDTLASAVNFNFDEHISHKFLMDFVLRVSSFPRQDSESRLTRVLDAIEESSFRYMQKTGRSVVLVIDGINFLNGSMPGALDKIKEKAKLWADTNTVKLILVNNDEDTLDSLQNSTSCWSRAAEPIIVGDLTPLEATKFLTNGIYMENFNNAVGLGGDVTGFRMDREHAERIVDMVGGRMIHLIAFKRDFAAGIPFCDTYRQLMNHEQEKFVRVSRKPSQWKVVSELRKAPNKTLKLSKVIRYLSEDDVHGLLRLNVIRIERSNVGALVKFFSPLTEHIVDELEKTYKSEREQQQQQQPAHHIIDGLVNPPDGAVVVFGSFLLFSLVSIVMSSWS